MRVTCPYCQTGFSVPDTQEIIRCPACARKISAVSSVTPEVPSEPVDDVDTPKTEVPDAPQIPLSPKPWSMTARLCLFLGIFGAHRFYVGKYGTGVIWMLTFGCAGIGWLSDCVLVFTGHMKDRDGAMIRKREGERFGWF